MLGMRDSTKETSNTSSDCWQEVERILLNSSHQYTACVYSRLFIDLCISVQHLKTGHFSSWHC